MKRIGFIGAYDKANFIIYIAKILQLLNYKVLVVDTSSIQKMKYIVPSINPTKTYITNFENIDFAIGFENWKQIERYLGIKFYSNEEDYEENEIKEEENDEQLKENKNLYDYILLDIDSPERLESFEMEEADKKYFLTSFDSFSLKKGISIFSDLKVPMNLTKVLFSYERSKDDEEYLNYISLEYKIVWNEYSIYFQILGDDNKVFEENQKFEKIKFKKLSMEYKESLAYVVQDMDKNNNIAKIKRIIKE